MQREVEMESGVAGWLPAQLHHGENIGETPTHVVFVELKDVDRRIPSDPAITEIGPR